MHSAHDPLAGMCSHDSQLKKKKKKKAWNAKNTNATILIDTQTSI